MIDLLSPKDPQEQRKGFYVLLDQKVGGEPQPDGVGRHPIFLDGDRLTTLAKIVGGVSDEDILRRLTTASGFHQAVHSIGVSASAADSKLEMKFSLVFYGDGPVDRYSFQMKADGVETEILLSELAYADQPLGQFLFELPTDQDIAVVTVKLYLNDGYDAPEIDPDGPVDMASCAYHEMIARSFLSGGNNYRVKRFLEKLKDGHDVTIAYLGGSITQGAGAVPIQAKCYARKSSEAIRSQYASVAERFHYIKAGVGGTPSQLGILRYDRDVRRDWAGQPDLVVIEFAVNDEGDETKGVCYESLVRKVLDQPNCPAIILLFSVFANDWNLKERLAPIGFRYQLPMVDVLDAVSPQFVLSKDAGRVVSKRQFFYDIYHPSNIGHEIMADCLLYLLNRLDRQTLMPPPKDSPPLYGTYYAGVRLLDRKCGFQAARITPGGFTQRDKDLQTVPLDNDTKNTPQFPYNWQKGPGGTPFILEISCKSLMLIFKDSEKRSFGKAQVRVDGVLTRTLDPRAVGWTHCHATLLFHGQKSRYHRIEISMVTEDKDKTFTILGFGYVP